jgi:multiple sugar transport system permease protein
MKKLGKKKIYKIIKWTLDIIVLLFLLFPIAVTVVGSLQTEKQLISQSDQIIPKKLTLFNYRLLAGKEVLALTGYVPPEVKHFPRAFFNSTLISTITTFLVLAFGAFSAYTISRLNVGWTRNFMYLSLATRLVPIMTLMVPLFVTAKFLGLLNTLHGIIFVEVGFLLPYSIWILTAFFATLPPELEDSARVDGCTRFQAFLRIVIPLSTPGMASCGVIVFIMSWNELIVPLTLTNKSEFMTIPVLIATLTGDRFLFYTLMMAICMVAMIPSLILALLLRKYVISGLTAGALKG